MNSHRIETELTEDGKILLQNIPFNKGDEVKIIILEHNSTKKITESYPLKGTVLSYEDPFESATSIEDWDGLN